MDWAGALDWGATIMVQYPEWGLLLGIIPLLAIGYTLRFGQRKRMWAQFQHPSRWATTIRLSDSGVYFWQRVLTLLVLTSVIIALMRPQYGERFETVERQGRHIFFVVDTSLSMLAEDGAPNRLGTATYHIQQLVSRLSGDLVAIVPFASTAYVYVPLTHDYGALQLFLEDMHVGMIGSSGSNITQALSVVEQHMDPANAHATTIIVLTDGEFLPPLDTMAIRAMIKKMGVDMMVVGVGSRQGEPIPWRDPDTNTTALKKDRNGAIVLTKRDDAALAALAGLVDGQPMIDGRVSPVVADTLYSRLSTSETKRLASTQRVTRVDRYHVVLGLALVIAIIQYGYPRFLMRYTVIVAGILLMWAGPLWAAHPGVTAYNRQDYSAAIEAFKMALRDDPDNGALYYNLANAYVKAGEYDAAITAYHESLPLVSGDLKKQALYNLATAYWRNRDREAALAYYKQVLAVDPNHIKTKETIEMILRDVAPPDTSDAASETKGDNADEAGESNAQKPPTPSTDGDMPADAAEEGESGHQDDHNASPDGETDSNNRDSTAAGSETAADATQPNSQQAISNAQIHYLVDMAEKQAREKQQKAVKSVFEGDSW